MLTKPEALMPVAIAAGTYMVSTEPEPVAAVSDTLEYAPDEILIEPAGMTPGSVVPAGNVAVIVCPTASAPVALVAKLSDQRRDRTGRGWGHKCGETGDARRSDADYGSGRAVCACGRRNRIVAGCGWILDGRAQLYDDRDRPSGDCCRGRQLHIDTSSKNRDERWGHRSIDADKRWRN